MFFSLSVSTFMQCEKNRRNWRRRRNKGRKHCHILERKKELKFHHFSFLMWRWKKMVWNTISTTTTNITCSLLKKFLFSFRVLLSSPTPNFCIVGSGLIRLILFLACLSLICIRQRLNCSIEGQNRDFSSFFSLKNDDLAIFDLKKLRTTPMRRKKSNSFSKRKQKRSFSNQKRPNRIEDTELETQAYTIKTYRRNLTGDGSIL